MSSSFILLFPPPSLLRLHLCLSEGRPSSPGRQSWRVSHGSSEEMLAIKRHRGSIGLYTRGRSSQVFSVWCMCMCLYSFHPPFNLPSFLPPHLPSHLSFLTFLPILPPHLPSHPSSSPSFPSFFLTFLPILLSLHAYVPRVQRTTIFLSTMTRTTLTPSPTSPPSLTATLATCRSLVSSLDIFLGSHTLAVSHKTQRRS